MRSTRSGKSSPAAPESQQRDRGYEFGIKGLVQKNYSSNLVWSLVHCGSKLDANGYQILLEVQTCDNLGLEPILGSD